MDEELAYRILPMQSPIQHNSCSFHKVYLVKWTRIVLANVAGMISKLKMQLSVTLNVADMDKINIVSSQAVLEMSSFIMDTRQPVRRHSIL